MTKHELPDRNIFDTLYRQLQDAIRRIGRLENSKAVTLPVYDLSNLPPLLENSLFIGQTDGKVYLIKNGIPVLV